MVLFGRKPSLFYLGGSGFNNLESLIFSLDAFEYFYFGFLPFGFLYISFMFMFKKISANIINDKYLYLRLIFVIKIVYFEWLWFHQFLLLVKLSRGKYPVCFSIEIIVENGMT